VDDEDEFGRVVSSDRDQKGTTEARNDRGRHLRKVSLDLATLSKILTK
jgi:hypothetical protein